MNAYMFGGEQYDLDLNLYYLRARWYNQRTGRFVTADKYEGVVNDPSTHIDTAIRAGIRSTE